MNITKSLWENPSHLLITVLSALLLTALYPLNAAALSCLSPSDMISEYYVTDDSYVIAVAVAGELEAVGPTHDQQLQVQTVYQGELAAETVVSYTYNEFWEYMCVGRPAEVGAESVYVIRDGQVEAFFPVGSELANQLIAEVRTEPTAPTEIEESTEPTTPTEPMEPVEPTEPEPIEPMVPQEKDTLMKQVVALLQQLIALLTNATNPAGEGPVVDVDPVDQPDYIGLSVAAATQLADTNSVPFRVVELDGEPQAVTMDYRPGRINASVESDVVTSYTVE